jgi:hypothetical protein
MIFIAGAFTVNERDRDHSTDESVSTVSQPIVGWHAMRVIEESTLRRIKSTFTLNLFVVPSDALGATSSSHTVFVAVLIDSISPRVLTAVWLLAVSLAHMLHEVRV